MADPAGNRTAFVEDRPDRSEYARIGNALMAAEDLRAEQVGYLNPAPSGADGAMCMMGGEFCGNATRSFGYLLGKRKGLKAGDTVRVSVSGAEHILTVTLEEDGASVEMTAPRQTGEKTFLLSSGNDCRQETMFPYVELEGITHVLIQTEKAAAETAEAVLHAMKEETEAEAAGAIFLHRIEETTETGTNHPAACFDIDMTPVVWVRETDSTVWESSCGSGSVACAVLAAEKVRDGNVLVNIHQPGGILRVTVFKQNGLVKKTVLGGPVKLENPVAVEIQVS